MKLFRNQKGFNDAVTIAIIGGIIGAIFIGGVFVWQEVGNQKDRNFLTSLMQINTDKPNDINEEELSIEKISSVVNRQKNSYYFSGIFEAVSKECRYEECLLRDVYAKYVPEWIFGTFKIKGWYEEVDRVGEGNMVSTCDTIFIEEAPEEIMNLYPDGWMNVMLSQLNEDDMQKLTGSSEENPVELILFQYPALGAKGSACFSYVDVVKVK